MSDPAPDEPPSPKPAKWDVVRERPHADCRIFQVYKTRFRHPVRESESDFYVIHTTDWVNVIALSPEGKLVLVRQYRYGIRDFSLEIPGGMMDRDESPVDAAKRELVEETGYTGTSGQVLGTVHPNPAIQSNRCHLVLIEGARKTGATQWDGNEEMETEVVPVETVFRWAREGRITHSLVLNALWLFEPRWKAMQRGSR